MLFQKLDENLYFWVGNEDYLRLGAGPFYPPASDITSRDPWPSDKDLVELIHLTGFRAERERDRLEINPLRDSLDTFHWAYSIALPTESCWTYGPLK